MRRSKGEVEEQRRLRLVLHEARDRVLAEQLRHIALFLDGPVVTVPIPHLPRRMREVIDLAHHGAVVVVEPALPRPERAVGVAEVPLADHDRAVARLPQGLRQQPLVGRQAIFARSRDGQSLQAIPERVAPGHERGPISRQLATTMSTKAKVYRAASISSLPYVSRFANIMFSIK